MNPVDKNGMSGVAVQPQAIRTFMIRYGDAARKSQPAPIVIKPHAIIEVAPSKQKPAAATKKRANTTTTKPEKVPAPEKVSEEVKEQEQEEAPRNAEPTRIEVKVVKGRSEEAAAKEATPKIWKELKSADKRPPVAKQPKKASKASGSPAVKPKQEKAKSDQPHTKNAP